MTIRLIFDCNDIGAFLESGWGSDSLIIYLLFRGIVNCGSSINKSVVCLITLVVVCPWHCLLDISCSIQCSTTGVTKAVVCAILFVGWCI